MSDVRQRVANVISQVIDYPQEEIDTIDYFQEIPKWDSLHNINVVLGLENEFGISFNVDEITSMTSVTSTTALIQSKRAT